MRSWLFEGVPKRKLLLGLDLSQRTFPISHDVQHVRNHTAMKYCDLFEENRDLTSEDKDNSDLEGFEDMQSIRLITQFIKHERYGGAFVDSCSSDDELNKCGKGYYPLLRTMAERFAGWELETGRLQDCPVHSQLRG